MRMMADEVKFSMTVMIIIGMAGGAAVLCLLRRKGGRLRAAADGLAALCFLCISVVTARSVLQTLLHDNVFTTEVHDFLPNPYFLISGAYLLPYVLCLLISSAWCAARR
jgi:tellurite resistance protein TehA-like permease